MFGGVKFKILERVIIVLLVIGLSVLGVRAVDNWRDKDDTGVCEEGMVFIPSPQGGLCVDEYEAGPGAKCPYASIQSQAETLKNIDTQDCVPVSAPGQEPWRFISRDQAAWACSKAGKRLLSSSEWQQAAYGTPDEKDNCQTENNWDKQPGPTGSAPDCISSSGAYDMIGNVWEWVSDTVNDGSLNGEKLADNGYVKGIGNNSLAVISSDESQVNYNNDYFWIKQSGQKAVARGGYWDSNERGGIFSAYVVAPPDQAEVGIGFRCAR